MDYIKFANKFYKEKIQSLDGFGFERSLTNFHLVDMYPSIKAMKNFLDPKEFLGIVKKVKHLTNQASIYIHFPFCKNICSYCHIYKENSCFQKNIEQDYVTALIKEIEIYAKLFNKKIIANSIYFGGGTPSLMSIDSLNRILDALRYYFYITEDAFISFEFYPEINFNKQILINKLNILKSFGIKEIVLDLQSTNINSLRDVGRANTDFSSWKKIIKIIKRVGIDRIKTSIIIGLPFDNLKTFKKTVFDISNTKDLSTISLFLLEFRKGLRIFDELINKVDRFSTSGERDQMQIVARKILHDKGFYESPIHFFNKNKFVNKKSKKKSVISTSERHLLGFGPSSYGHIVTNNTSIKYYNTADINLYINKIKKGQIPISKWHCLNKEEMIFSKLIDDISSDGVINKVEINNIYNYDVENKFKKTLDKFESLGLIKNDNKKIIVTEAGKLRTEEMLWYLYDKKYKDIQRKLGGDKEIKMHNYVTIISQKNEVLFDNFRV